MLLIPHLPGLTKKIGLLTQENVLLMLLLLLLLLGVVVVVVVVVVLVVVVRKVICNGLVKQKVCVSYSVDVLGMNKNHGRVRQEGVTDWRCSLGLVRYKEP